MLGYTPSVLLLCLSPSNTFASTGHSRVLLETKMLEKLFFCNNNRKKLIDWALWFAMLMTKIYLPSSVNEEESEGELDDFNMRRLFPSSDGDVESEDLRMVCKVNE
ncbi:hypothetical protein L2E82_24474 [Cichorium intybus]|uniref:Uncharacterized protein n=1 Tax=Cichorium intybus TaxID=13427 RepID=A0ACB9E1V6_CICIN|nr:hypothetical protein L2E82_24474 [Cichorium intybus]